jgi:hypothetical protein
MNIRSLSSTVLVDYLNNRRAARANTISREYLYSWITLQVILPKPCEEDSTLPTHKATTRIE